MFNNSGFPTVDLSSIKTIVSIKEVSWRNFNGAEGENRTRTSEETGF